jgi:hypothetical protein
MKRETRDRATQALTGGGLFAVVAGLLLGINDNPPGILLLYVGLLSSAFALLLRWERANRGRLFFLLGLVGFPVMVVLHNAGEAVAGTTGLPTLLVWLMQAIAVLSFFLAVLIAPVLMLSGLIGWVCEYFTERKAH